MSSVTLAGGGSASFTYDGNGNMLSGPGKTLTYNAFNKPLTITADPYQVRMGLLCRD